MTSQELTNLKNELRKLVPKYTQFLTELVKQKSVYGNEKCAQDLVVTQMQKIGLDSKIFFSRSDQQSMNVVAVLKGTDSSAQSLVLNAHCDISPVDQEERWTIPPFEGKIIDNLLYGRGAQDDKAGIAIMLLLADLLKSNNIKLKGDLILQSVIEDETTGNGSKILIENGYDGDGVIILDGTWPERVIYAHLGQIWIDVAISGDPVAACVESRGVNPIYIAIEFIEKLKNQITDWKKENQSFENLDSAFFANIGSFHSGVWHGSVPADAKLEIQIGFSDKFTPESVMTTLNRLAAETSTNITITRSKLALPAYKVDQNNKIISTLKSAIASKTKNEIKVIPVSGHCDMRHFKTSNICLYGPGGGKNAHGIDEYYILDHMPIVAENVLETVINWCN